MTTRHFPSVLPLFLGLVFSASLPGSMCGQTVTNSWTNGFGGRWQFATNWSLGVAPLSNHAIVAFTNFNSKVVVVDDTVPAVNLSLRNLTVSAFQNRQNTLVLSNLAAPMDITRGCTLGSGAVLQVLNSRVNIDGTLLGELTLTGASAALTDSVMVLTNGTLLKIGNGAGAAAMHLTNSTVRAGADLRVGALNRSMGRLSLAGGLVDIGGEFTVADATGSTGAVVIAHGTLQAVNTNVNARIGQRGLGSLTLLNGAANFDDVSVGRQDGGRGELMVAGGDFVCGTLSVGRFSNAVGVATMTGGRMDVRSGSLYVGREGAGTLTNAGGQIAASRLVVAGATNTASGAAWLQAGESVFIGGMIIGSQVSTGLVTVTGGLLACTNGSGTSTGLVASGTLAVHGGRVDLDALLVTGPAGRLDLQGGVLAVRHLVVSNGAPFLLGDGVHPTVLQLSGPAVFEQGIIVAANATIAGCGSISGAVTVLDGGSFAIAECPPPQVSPITLRDVGALPGGLRFSFNADAGVIYTVEFRDGLDPDSGGWQVLSPFAGNGGLIHVTNLVPAAAARTYRVRTP